MIRGPQGRTYKSHRFAVAFARFDNRQSGRMPHPYISHLERQRG